MSPPILQQRPKPLLPVIRPSYLNPESYLTLGSIADSAQDIPYPLCLVIVVEGRIRKLPLADLTDAILLLYELLPDPLNLRGLDVLFRQNLHRILRVRKSTPLLGLQRSALEMWV